MKRRNRGFTLLELLVVVAILAILGAVAGPSMMATLQTQQVKNASFDVFASLMLARSEAIKRNVSVTITPSGGNWSNGWTVTDANANILRQRSAYSNVTIAGPANVVYNGTGRLAGATPPQFALSAVDVTSGNQRCIKLNLSGEPVSTQGACT